MKTQDAKIIGSGSDDEERFFLIAWRDGFVRQYVTVNVYREQARLDDSNNMVRRYWPTKRDRVGIEYWSVEKTTRNKVRAEMNEGGEVIQKMTIPNSDTQKLKLTEDLVSSLESAANVLNSRSTELSEPIDAINVALKSLNMGIRVWHSYYEVSGERHLIGYDKIDNKWGVALSVQSTIDDDFEAWHFRDAPRSMRIQAVHYLPQLLRQCLCCAEELIEEIGRATNTARATSAQLSKGLGKK
jgi:hypothetical protein